MLHPRYYPGGLQVSPNEVLVFNGRHNNAMLNQAEIYNLVSEQWTDLGSATPGPTMAGNGVMIQDETGENVAIISGEATSQHEHNLND